MTTSEERLRILRMVDEGKVTATEAANLIGALDGAAGGVGADREGKAPATGGWSRAGRRHVTVRVTDTTTGRVKVRLALPMALAETGLRLAGRYLPGQSEAWDEIVSFLRSGEVGRVVAVEDDDEAEIVEVAIE